MKALRVQEAMPATFGRPVATVEKGTLAVVAGTLLGLPRRDALLIASTEGGIRYLTRGGKWMAFAGYPLLKALLEAKPKDLYRTLFRPCENASMFLDSVRSDDGLEGVLEAFRRTKFGYALVESNETFGLITLSDILLLYQQGMLETRSQVRDLASSPVFSLPSDATLREVAREFYNRRVRRVRVGDQNRFVSDREILAHLFSPSTLNLAKESPEEMLEAALGEVSYHEAVDVDGSMQISRAAQLVDPGSGNCLTVDGGKGLVTPWDILMKPWEAGELKIVEGIRP
ncbi:MAG: CBS domain-containing protein [Nitrososphaerota archaeon]|nr:CBS domain-containing protein [Nitrososphaerota archaeon]